MLSGKRIVLTTFGSLGDLHPYIALAIGLRERGHSPVLATHEVYRSKIEGEGIAFHPVAPDLTDFGDEREFTRRAFAKHGGIEFLIKTVVIKPLRQSYADLDAAVSDNTDLLIAHPLTFAAPLIAEKRKLPWLSVALAPASFMSAYDPFVFPQAPFISRLQPMLGPIWYRKLLNVIQKVPYRLTDEVRAFRPEIGLPSSTADPLFAGQFSPFGTLALFSSALGAPQPDWHPKTVQTGFCFYDKLAAGSGLTPETEAFLQTGEPPIVFTLGSAAVMDAGAFYTVSVEAAAQLGRRAILLTGKDASNIPATLPGGVIAVPYAPYSELFGRSAVLVHQGGVGTTGQSLRSGRPQLVVPHGFDQPDNAFRMVQRGVGRTVDRFAYTVPNVTRELSTLLTDKQYAERAANLGEQVRNEDGIHSACDAVEAVLGQ
ncbi:MAG: glycosyltransferase family 1 protein [Fibrella sp.]|nr:glycosyltransferase family 1 protein [Armatimonadota bacterium]